MLSKNGIPMREDISAITPSETRLNKSAVALIECFQEIPCDPCAVSCPHGAIKPFSNINDLPTIDHEQCNGCALCVAACPGLAIFVIDYSFSPDNALIKIPHEFVPVPAKGESVDVLSRNGKVLGKGTVERAVTFKDKTTVVHVVVSKTIAMEARAIAPLAYEKDNVLREFEK